MLAPHARKRHQSGSTRTKSDGAYHYAAVEFEVGFGSSEVVPVQHRLRRIVQGGRPEHGSD